MSDLILYTTEDGRSQIQLRTKDQTVWLSQREMAELFAVSADNISLHLKNLYEDGELSREATTEESSVVQSAGGKGIGRAFSPREIVSTGFLGRCPRLVWRWAFGPETQTAPTARLHTSLGQRPRYATPTRIEG
ncbi:MAG: hypothetical protein KBF76_13105 [Verrucomicrobiales bacterium]|jgi:hypothetical protein|nr:hypothetical protein [Verrucomicrobiales bacterium]